MTRNCWRSLAARSIEAGNSSPSSATRSASGGPVLPQGEPGIGSPALGKMLDITGLRAACLRAWRVSRFPLLWFERDDHLDVDRLGERQDIAAMLAKDT